MFNITTVLFFSRKREATIVRFPAWKNKNPALRTFITHKSKALKVLGCSNRVKRFDGSEL